MRTFSSNGVRRAKAFTLVELLVVIGIIAVLVGILLPVLSGARRQASLVQCSSNMRQIAMSMLTYIQDNKGRLMPCQIKPGAGGFPNGWWWATELTRLRYIKAPNCFSAPGAPPSFIKSNVFRCPEGLDEDILKGGAGDYPTDAKNNGYQLSNQTEAQTEGFGIPSWYMLNSRNLSASGAWPPNGSNSKVTPFLYFNNSPADADLKDIKWQRTLSMIRRSGEMIMIVESADSNWFDQSQSSKYPNIYLRRLAARHGKRTADGANAKTNFAFFDGHVALYDTLPYTKKSPNATGTPDNSLIDYYQETIFFVNKQKGKW